MSLDEISLDPRIEAYIIDNIDLDPAELVQNIKLKFGDICNGAQCLCENITKVNELYLKYGKADKLPAKLHNRLMERLSESCEG